MAVFKQYSTQQSHRGSSLSAAPSGPQVSTGLPGVLSHPRTPTPHGPSASPSIGGTGISNNPNVAANVLNEYDKAVEVDQRKLRDTELTPMALRKWKLAYNIYAKDPNKRMKMTEAFGEESMRCLGFMFSGEPIPLDDAGFDVYLNTEFLKSVHLFSDIKMAVSKIRMTTPLTVESLQAYHSGFCRALIPLLDEIQLQNTSPDLHVTLIKAIFDGIQNSFAYKLKETSCSTWMAAQNNFRDCLKKSNVQLAVAHANKAADFRQYDKKYDNFEGKKALSATKSNTPRLARIPQISKTPPTQPSQTPRPTVEPPSQVLDTG